MADFDLALPLGDVFPRTTRLKDLPKQLVRDLRRSLHSANEEKRRWAVQGFVKLGISPIAAIKCWPEKKCTVLQLATAETLIREWLECVEEDPEAFEGEIISALFPIEMDDDLDDEPKLRVRRLAKNKSNPPKSNSPNLIAQKVEAWSDTIKEKLLDWDLIPEANELSGSDGDDCPLAPLEREKFLESMRAKIDESWQQITQILAEARTDYELVAAEQAIHPILSTLRWEAIAVALELRDPYLESLSADEIRDLAESIAPTSQPTKFEPKPTGNWAGKYRRMRSSGL
jgi:hypothetical protein